MVELRKRPPPKEPPAPAPAAKRGRGAASSKKAKPAGKKESVASKAKQAATKVKQAVVGNDANENSTTKTTADMQPTVEDEAAVEKGEGGMIPETAGTAPNTVTVPASASTEPAGPEAEDTQTAPGKANLPPAQTPAEHAAVNDKAAALGIVGSSAAGPTPATDAAAAPEQNTAATDSAAAAAEEAARPPATEDLENPPETGKVEPASGADNAGAEVSLQDAPLATLPLSTASVGKQLPDISTLGGSVETHTGATVSLGSLLAACTSGIIIFTYPRASTPGCTQQACLFRDNYNAFTKDTGYKVYGLSMDTVKANGNFATKQNLQYELLCDKEGGLVGAIGMKKPGNAKGTVRGVVVVEKHGGVRVWCQGGPAKTVEVVREFLETVKK